MSKAHGKLALAASLLLAAAPAPAQWLNLRTPGIPRTPDGKPDLKAPAPRLPNGKPDLAGVWQMNGKYLQDIAADLKPGDVPYQPWAEALYNQRRTGTRSIDDPAARCIPGMPKLTNLPYPFKIINTPDMLLILSEGFTTFRQIFTDGRALPKDPQPAWLGYSVGQWEGDDFVVHTVGINATTWLDNAGRPHTDALQMTERFRRLNFGRLDIVVTFDDPKAYTRPWSVTEQARLMPDTDLLEYACSEDEKDYPHLSK